MIFDVRFDGCRKYCLVAGGHRTPDIPQEVVYSGGVSVETIYTAFVISALNGLEVCVADVSTAFLYVRTHEKVYIIAGPEFGEHADKRMMIDGGLYGVKTSSAHFHEHLVNQLCKMGFKALKADYDLGYCSGASGDHYAYLTTYVDDILAFFRDPMAIINDIQKDYSLKGVGTAEYYLGGNFHTTKDVDNIVEVDNEEAGCHLPNKRLTENITTAFSAETTSRTV